MTTEEFNQKLNECKSITDAYFDRALKIALKDDEVKKLIAGSPDNYRIPKIAITTILKKVMDSYDGAALDYTSGYTREYVKENRDIARTISFAIRNV